MMPMIGEVVHFVMVVMNMHWNMNFFDDWHMHLLDDGDVFNHRHFFHHWNLLYMVVMDGVNLVRYVDLVMLTVNESENHLISMRS